MIGKLGGRTRPADVAGEVGALDVDIEEGLPEGVGGVPLAEVAQHHLGGADERDLTELLRVALGDVGAPEEQLQRLGLA